jgi:hypothetical protein
MAETRIEKLKTSPEAASTEAVANAVDAVPVVMPTAVADCELSDEDLDRVSGGAGQLQSVRPQVRGLLGSSPSY